MAAPIFIVGTPRSGTTLLRQMFNAHPAVHLTHEASFYPGNRRRRDAASFARAYLRSVHFRWLALDPDSLDLRQATRRADVARRVMQALARRHGKQRYGDKTPLHAGHLADVFADFPDAKVLHIVRDPRAVVASMRGMPWAPASYSLSNRFAARLVTAVDRFRERLHELRLEDLLTDPEHEMRRALAFCELPFDRRVLAHHEHAPVDTPPVPWFARAHRARSQTGAERWRTALPPVWIRLIEDRNAAIMHRFRYERVTLPQEPSAVERRRATRRDLPDLWRALRFGVPLARAMGKKEPVPAARVEALLRRLNPTAWQALGDFRLPELPTPRPIEEQPRWEPASAPPVAPPPCEPTS